jgi:group I intron endonuclease
MRGIYVIICWADLKLYVGSSFDIKGRLDWHKGNLRKSHHFNPYLQNAWNKYGEAAFEFGVYKAMPGASWPELIAVERRLYHLWEGDRFNIVVPDTPPTLNPEVAAKISASNKGHVVSDETRAKISAANKGRRWTPEQRANQSRVLKGRTLTPEHRAKIGESSRGRRHTKATKRKLRDIARAQWERQRET